MSDQAPAEFAAWSLAWAEEFDGPAGSPADPRTWRPETGGHGWETPGCSAIPIDYIRVYTP